MKDLIKNFKDGVKFSCEITESDFNVILSEVIQNKYEFFLFPNTGDGKLSCFINCEQNKYEKFHLFHDNVKQKMYYFPNRIAFKPIKCRDNGYNEYVIKLLDDDFEDYLMYKLNVYKIKLTHTYKLDGGRKRFIIKCDYEYVNKLLEVPFINFINPMAYAVLD